MNALLIALLLATPSAVERMLDAKLTAAQRNDACFELKGQRSDAVVDALREALRNEAVRACAAQSLREIGAADVLKDALADPDPEVRALAAREGGALQQPELLEPLARAARDPNPIVALSAVQGLAAYDDPRVLPYLIELAERGDSVGILALNRAAAFRDCRALEAARSLLETKDPGVQLAAIRVIGELGDRSDLTRLAPFAKNNQELAPAGRGFGLIPAVTLSRAARVAQTRVAQTYLSVCGD